MELTQQSVIALLKAAVTGQPQALPQGFDMAAAYPLIQSHHIAALCFDGAVRCGVSRAEPVMQKLFLSYCRAMQVSEGQMRELGRIYAAFDAAGIDYMPLKGSNMKALYPRPELRLMGDADVLIRLEQYPRIVPIMESLGFTPVLESDHELNWRSPALYLELHKYIIPTYNRDYYGYFGDGWKLARHREGFRWSMSAEDTYLYLFTHFAKHYRDGGIGCRHVVDLWVYRRTHPLLDEGYLRGELEKLQLLEFYENIGAMIGAWFCGGPESGQTEVLSTCIFASGSWGSREDKVLSGIIKHSRHSLLGFNGRLLYLRRQLFPDAGALQGRYPVLKRAPWLLPGVWVVRLVSRLPFRHRKLKQLRRNLSALKQEKLDERHRMLRYVGLDYNF